MVEPHDPAPTPEPRPPAARPSALAAGCPFLGLRDDPASHLMFPIAGHRCGAGRVPVTVDLARQGELCLTDRHPACERFVAHRDAEQASGTPLAIPDPPGAGPSAPRPAEPAALPEPASPGRDEVAVPPDTPPGDRDAVTPIAPVGGISVAPRSESAVTGADHAVVVPAADPDEPPIRPDHPVRGLVRRVLVGLAFAAGVVAVFAALVVAGYIAGGMATRHDPAGSASTLAPAPAVSPAAAVASASADPVTPAPTPAPATPAPAATATSTPAPTPPPSPSPAASPTPVATPAPTPRATPAPTPRPSPTPRVYVVRRNDTLSAIASRFGVSVPAIMEANDLTDAGIILVGQRLVIPTP